MGLGRYEVYASLLAGGERAAWASARTRAPQLSLRPAGQVRGRSRSTYGQDGAAVEAGLAALLAHGGERSTDGPIGRRPRGGRS